MQITKDWYEFRIPLIAFKGKLYNDDSYVGYYCGSSGLTDLDLYGWFEEETTDYCEIFIVEQGWGTSQGYTRYKYGKHLVVKLKSEKDAMAFKLKWT